MTSNPLIGAVNRASRELDDIGRGDLAKELRDAALPFCTPPADGVREAARKRLDEREEYAEQQGYPTFQDEPSAYLNGFEDGAVFKVRPRGTVTDVAEEREALAWAEAELYAGGDEYAQEDFVTGWRVADRTRMDDGRGSRS